MSTQQRPQPARSAPASGAAYPLPAAGGASRTAVMVWSALTLAATVAVTFVLGDVALTSQSGQDLDQSAMEAVYAREDTLERLLGLLGNVSIGTTAVAVAGCLVLALVRRRYAAAAGALVVVVGANVTTQVLKRVVFDRPDFGHLSINSLPSGHATVVTSVVLAGLLVAPAYARTVLVVLGTFAATFTAASTVVAGWHRPSDVLAAYAVSLAWGAGVVFVLAVRRPGRFGGSLSTQLGLALAGAAVAGVLLIAIGVRPDEGWPGFTDAALVLGGVGLAATLTVAAYARLSSVHSA